MSKQMCDSITTADSGGKKRIHMSLFFHSERWSVKWTFLSFCMNLALEKRFWEYFSKYMISSGFSISKFCSRKRKPDLLWWKFVIRMIFLLNILISKQIHSTYSRKTEEIKTQSYCSTYSRKTEEIKTQSCCGIQVSCQQILGPLFSSLVSSLSMCIVTSLLQCVPSTSLVS